MARPRTFDETKVLDAAIECFWQRGLKAASVRDLAEEMGLNCPSVYNAFGDKRALFILALERYAVCYMRERIARLERLASPKAAIRTFMEEMVERAAGDPERRGCLIINSALEVAPHDPELGGIVAGYLGELEGFFRSRILAGQALGEIPAYLDAGDTARLLLSVQTGLRLLGRVNPERAHLEGMARPALALLDLPPHPSAKGKP